MAPNPHGITRSMGFVCCSNTCPLLRHRSATLPTSQLIMHFCICDGLLSQKVYDPLYLAIEFFLYIPLCVVVEELCCDKLSFVHGFLFFIINDEHHWAPSISSQLFQRWLFILDKHATWRTTLKALQGSLNNREMAIHSIVIAKRRFHICQLNYFFL